MSAAGKHTCPRRADLLGFRGEPDADDYETKRNGYHVCSYCGSVEPAEFLQAVRDGKEVGPTDKGYKVYLDNHAGKFNPGHMTPEQGSEFKALYADGKVNMGYPGHFYTPLYVPQVPSDEATS